MIDPFSAVIGFAAGAGCLELVSAAQRRWGKRTTPVSTYTMTYPGSGTVPAPFIRTEPVPAPSHVVESAPVLSVVAPVIAVEVPVMPQSGHAVCSICKLTVARYENRNGVIVCQNCKE